MDALSPEIQAALEASLVAKQLFSRLVLEHAADVTKTVTIADVLGILCLAEFDPDQPTGDYFRIAKFLAERLA